MPGARFSRTRNKSLFASFSSEKEDVFSLESRAFGSVAVRP
jgi:hypothetical protein